MRFDFIVSFPHPEVSFLRAEAQFGVRAFEGDEDSLLLKSHDLPALNAFFAATGMEGLKLESGYRRSHKFKVSKKILLKAAAKNFPNESGMEVKYINTPYHYAYAPKVEAEESNFLGVDGAE